MASLSGGVLLWTEVGFVLFFGCVYVCVVSRFFPLSPAGQVVV